MKNKARVIGWVCFWIALIVYAAATCYFGIGFADAIAAYKSGESLGFATWLLLFMVFGSIAYAVSTVVSIIGALAANIKRGENKFFFVPVITFALSVLTWIVFYLIGISM